MAGFQHERLAEFRRLAAGRSFHLGETDCGMLCADWVRMVRGVDPAAEWRGRYHTVLGLARILKRRGGLVGHFDQCLNNVGIHRTDQPRRGDVAVVKTPEPEGVEGAIVLDGVVLMAARAGGIIIRSLSIAPIVAAWRVDP